MNIYTLKNKNGIEVDFMAHGGRITAIKIPTKNGSVTNVVLGYDSPELALNGDLYFGALCGRYANRISKGSFEIDGVKHHLDCNDGGINHLHGGVNGFHTKNWEVKSIADNRFQLSLISHDNDENYPGELMVDVTYTLTDNDEFVIEFSAHTNKSTIINLTSHPYFNLKGMDNGGVGDHQLKMYANKYTPISEELGTTSGDIADVINTPFDFTDFRYLGDAIQSPVEQIVLAGGLDHTFVLNKQSSTIGLAATLFHAETGRKLDVFTNQPGLHVYLGNHFDGTEIGRNGTAISKHIGIALESQIFPDSPNKANFPNSILHPGEIYNHICIYKFSDF